MTNSEKTPEEVEAKYDGVSTDQIKKLLSTYGAVEELSEPLTPEQQAYYNDLAEKLAKECPDPDCICKKGDDG